MVLWDVMPVIWYMGRARLLCDGANLRVGGEVKGKQNSGVSKPVTRHSNTETSCQQRTELSTPHREYGLVRSAHTRKLYSAHV
jgi:hypothetical protein